MTEDMTASNSRDPIVIHVPKTGGTTLIVALVASQFLLVSFEGSSQTC